VVSCSGVMMIAARESLVSAVAFPCGLRFWPAARGSFSRSRGSGDRR